VKLSSKVADGYVYQHNIQSQAALFVVGFTAYSCVLRIGFFIKTKCDSYLTAMKHITM